jgi:hypothetical protein
MPHDFDHEHPKVFAGEEVHQDSRQNSVAAPTTRHNQNRDNLGYHEHPIVREMAGRLRSWKISSELANRGSRSWKN